jgi:hypothetical protein
MAANSCCPGLCLSRVCRTPVGASGRGRSSISGSRQWTGRTCPASLIDRQPIRFRWLSALELGTRRLPILPGPRWSAGPRPASRVGRSSAIHATDAWFIRRRSATHARTNIPYEVSRLLERHVFGHSLFVTGVRRNALQRGAQPTLFSTASGVYGLVAGPSRALRSLNFE